jgi:hypothetical protein
VDGIAQDRVQWRAFNISGVEHYGFRITELASRFTH